MHFQLNLSNIFFTGVQECNFMNGPFATLTAILNMYFMQLPTVKSTPS